MSLAELVRLRGNQQRQRPPPLLSMERLRPLGALVLLICGDAVAGVEAGRLGPQGPREPERISSLAFVDFRAVGWGPACTAVVVGLGLLLVLEVGRKSLQLRRLKRQIAETIERRVAERTRELSRTNAELIEQLNASRDTESHLRSAQASLEETTQRYVLLSEIDPLTNLANRRKFDGFLSREWRRGVRNQEHLSLLLVDVDYFKLFNDTYGHGTGDDCLRAVAEVIAGAARRPGDLAARIGGEEFAVLLCDTGNDGAIIVAKQILSGIEQLAIDHETTRVSALDIVSVSIGVVSMLPDHSNGPNLIFYHADEALYAAKQSGRNCLRTYEESCDHAKSEFSIRAAAPSLRVHESLGRRSRS